MKKLNKSIKYFNLSKNYTVWVSTFSKVGNYMIKNFFRLNGGSK